MDILFTSLLSLLFVLIISYFLHFYVYSWKQFKDRNLLPHGRKGWPVIGETFEFLAAGWEGHPEKFIFDRMSKFSPIVFRTSLMLEDVAMLCGAQGNKFLFSNENKLLQAWLPASVVKIFPASTNTYKIETTELRKILRNILRPEALKRYVPIMDDVTQRYFESRWNGKKEVMSFEVTRNFAFWLACKIFLSIDNPEQARYLSGPFETILIGILSIPIDFPGTPFRRGINAAKFIRKEVEAIVKQRKVDLVDGKATSTQDLLSHMILFRDGNGKFLGEHDIVDKILGLLIGGHDTLSSTCASLVKYLAELPDIYNGVYNEQIEIAKSKAPGELMDWKDLSKMKYTWRVVCEVLRLAQPSQGFREVITDFVYKGFSIPKGWKLYWSAVSTHKSSEFFPEPEKFDPSRFEGDGPAPYTFVPFGGASQICPGKEYARLGILVFMHHLVTKFKWEKIYPDEQIVFNPMPRPAKGLPIRIYPHIF